MGDGRGRGGEKGHRDLSRRCHRRRGNCKEHFRGLEGTMVYPRHDEVRIIQWDPPGIGEMRTCTKHDSMMKEIREEQRRFESVLVLNGLHVAC